jgi:hypothetical protein
VSWDVTQFTVAVWQMGNDITVSWDVTQFTVAVWQMGNDISEEPPTSIFIAQNADTYLQALNLHTFFACNFT